MAFGKRTDSDRERLERRYRPRHIRLLFVGESPPASGRHFYAGDSGLYRAIRESFLTAFPPWRAEPDFLSAFRTASCVLVDLCERPVDDLALGLRRARCRASEPRLTAEIAATQPRAIVTVVRSIEANVRRAVAVADWEGETLALPYPGRWSRARSTFTAALVPALVRWAESGLLGSGRDRRADR